MTGLGDTIRPAPMRTHSTTTSTMADELCRIEVIAGVGRRRRWSDEDKARIVAECIDPTRTVSEMKLTMTPARAAQATSASALLFAMVGFLSTVAFCKLPLGMPMRSES